MTPKISIITAVYNDVASIEATIKSALSQNWLAFEYIIIDGGSTDGTVDIIKKYAEVITYWSTAPDGGVYDAMNKGIERCTGDFMIVLNSGDYFYSDTVFSDINMLIDNKWEDYDLIFGRSKIVKSNGAISDLIINHSYKEMWKGPCFRHGALLTRTSLMKEYGFEINENLKISADFDFIYKCYKNGSRFLNVDIVVVAFKEEGLSDEPFKHLEDCEYILKKYNDWNLKTKLYYGYKYSRVVLSRTIFKRIFKVFRIFFHDYFVNHWINSIPFYAIRHAYYRTIMNIKIGKGSSIHMNCFIYGNNIEIQENSTINRRCFLDGRGKLFIGNRVSISPEVHLITEDHDYNSEHFSGRSRDIYISDYVWIGSRAIILPGIKIGRGAVVCAGAVVTKNVEEFAVVAGVPAVKIKERNRNLNYNPSWFAYFD